VAQPTIGPGRRGLFSLPRPGVPTAGSWPPGHDLPAPGDAFGFSPGTPRRLIRWPALLHYFRRAAAASDRVKVEELGPDSLGQPLVLLTISSPANLARLDDLRGIQARLADPRRRGSGERGPLIAAGRVVVLVTCSIHATEVGAAQAAPELVHRLATADDGATRRLLDEVVLLLVPSLNPGGLELVADWYERTLGTAAEGTAPPGLYHPVAGHDNNRDWFMQTLPETRLLVGVHNAWRPQILFDLHQMQGNGPRYVLPPYVDPYDPNVDPLLRAQTSALGTAMAAALTAEGKTGVATGIIFDAYSPSRAYPHYHGGVRILAEAASPRIASPINLAQDHLAEARGFDPRAATVNHPAPWPGGDWTLRHVIDYHLTATDALLDHAARHREEWLDRFARVGERSLERTSPHAFVIPPLDRQPDPAAAAELLGVLLAGDVEVARAEAPFLADGIDVAAGAYVVPSAQPFGAFAKTLLEIQRYPSLALYPGGPPRPPYDVTGHTLGLQMGVDVTEVAKPIAPPTAPVTEPPLPPSGLPAEDLAAAAFIVPAETTAAARLVNRLLAAGARVSRLDAPTAAPRLGGRLAAGAFVVEGIAGRDLDPLARAAGAPAAAADRSGRLRRLRRPRVAVYHSWKPNAIDAGWTRHILADHGFAPVTLRDRDIRQGSLAAAHDAIVLPHGTSREILEGNSPAEYPAEVAGGLGEAGAAQLRRFVEQGGTLIALDAACDAAISVLYLPVANVLDRVRSDEFYSPGSLLRLLLDPAHPIAWGYERETVAMFVSSPAFELRPGHSPGHPVEPRVVARYPLGNPLLSGWILGHDLIAGRAALLDVPLGRGRAVLFGFRPQFRAQARVGYRLLFNALYLAAME